MSRHALLSLLVDSLTQTTVIHLFIHPDPLLSFLHSFHSSVRLSLPRHREILSANLVSHGHGSSRSSPNPGSMNELGNSKTHCSVLNCFVIIEDNIRKLIIYDQVFSRILPISVLGSRLELETGHQRCKWLASVRALSPIGDCSALPKQNLYGGFRWVGGRAGGLGLFFVPSESLL